MSVRCIMVVCAVALSMSGCAKFNKQFAANSLAIEQSDQTTRHVAHDDHLHPPGDDGIVPSDPISNAPPMPVALADQLKKLARPGNGGAVAFLGPTISSVSHESRIIGPAPGLLDPYLLDSGDRVRVFVYGQPNLSHVYPIDAAGFIAVPLIGSVKARGLTTYHLATEIAAQLKVSFVKDPQVSVESAASRPFYILGEVRAAGQYPFEPGITVEAAIAIAGSFGPRASHRGVHITRRQNGMLSEVHVPLTEAVRPGDTITIEERWF